MIPCARQIAQSTAAAHPRLVVSTLKEFCEHSNQGVDLDRGAVWAVELDALSGRVLKKARLVEQLLDPQGIDWADGNLYIATSGRGLEGRGNCVLRIADVDTIATQRFDGSLAVLEADDARVESVRCNFTSLQPAGHSRGTHGSLHDAQQQARHGADRIRCNWASDCLPSDSNSCTLLLMVDVSTGDHDRRQVRNAVGIFDRKGNFYGSTMAQTMARGCRVRRGETVSMATGGRRAQRPHRG